MPYKPRKTNGSKKIVFLRLEGRNKTEEKYLKALFSSTQYKVHVCSGNETDLPNMYRQLLETFDKLGTQGRDLAFCLFDIDADVQKAKAYETIKVAKKDYITLVPSNPCVEVFFLMHFKYSTKPFRNSDEAIAEFQKIVSDYEKSEPPIDLLQPRTAIGIKNSKQLETFHDKTKHDKATSFPIQALPKKRLTPNGASYFLFRDPTKNIHKTF